MKTAMAALVLLAALAASPQALNPPPANDVEHNARRDREFAAFDPRRQRFWTEADFPEAEAVRKKIVNFVERHRKTGGAGGGYYATVLEELR